MLRSLLKRIAPQFAARAEAESREWMVQCPKCGNEKSLWDAGGLRYKGAGTVRRLGKCSRCGQLRLLRIYHVQESGAAE